MNKTNISIIVAVVIVIAFGAYRYAFKPKTNVACTLEAKLCPDGSYVGRTGLSCEFAACPGAIATSTGTGGILSYDSGIRGTVMLGPTCPVERIPPDLACADKPYKTPVTIFRASDMTRAFILTQSDVNGVFSATMPPGEYVLGAGQSNLPRCNRTQVTVLPASFTSTTIFCDTGIR